MSFALEDLLGVGLADDGDTPGTFGIRAPVSLAFYGSATGDDDTGDGTEGNPWGLGTLELVRQARLQYAHIAQCVIQLTGANGTVFELPDEPFEVGVSERFGIRGMSFHQLATGTLTGAYSSAQASYGETAVTSTISGGIEQYVGKTFRITSGALSGYCLTIKGRKVLYDCDLATTANITLSGVQTVDGVTTAGNTATGGGNAKRILVKNQTNPVENGPYFASAGAWVRCWDADDYLENQVGELNNAQVSIVAGTVNHGTTWYLNVCDVEIGVDAQTWQNTDSSVAFMGGIYPADSLVNGDTFEICEPAITIGSDEYAKILLVGGGGSGRYPTSPMSGMWLVNVKTNCYVTNVDGDVHGVGWEINTSSPVFNENEANNTGTLFGGHFYPELSSDDTDWLDGGLGQYDVPFWGSWCTTWDAGGDCGTESNMDGTWVIKHSFSSSLGHNSVVLRNSRVRDIVINGGKLFMWGGLVDQGGIIAWGEHIGSMVWLYFTTFARDTSGATQSRAGFISSNAGAWFDVLAYGYSAYRPGMTGYSGQPGFFYASGGVIRFGAIALRGKNGIDVATISLTAGLDEMTLVGDGLWENDGTIVSRAYED